MATTAKTQGAHHVGLTVPDLARARQFFVETLGYALVGEVASYPAVFVSDGTTMITLWQAADPVSAVPFDRKNHVGLHHLALRVSDAAALESLHETLKGVDDVAIEFPPEPVGGGSSCHMMTYMPGGIRIEFFAPGT